MPSATDPIEPFIERVTTAVPHAPDGPLSGLTFAVKDIYDVAGYVTGCGNPTKRAESAPAERHATVVAALLGAGAEFAGKTHTVEFAFGMDGHNDHYGTPPNPAAPDRVPGGSSSGSVAAVGLGVVDLALGSDTGGSVRAPASFCDQIGLRTTFGRIDLSGTMPLAESLDTAGWFALDPAVYERVGEVLLGADEAGPELSRLIIPDDLWAVLDARVGEALTPGLERIQDALGGGEHRDLTQGRLGQWRELFRATQGFEAWRDHGPWIEAHPGALTDAVRERFEVSAKVSRAQYDNAAEARDDARARVDEILGDDGIMVLPTVPSAAPLRSAGPDSLEEFRAAALALTCASGLSGCPQISLPIARTDDAPIGLSLLAARGRDRELIAIGRRILGR